MMGFMVSGAPAEGSAAQAAGIREGDYLLRVGEESITSHNHLLELMAKYEGQPVVVEVLRIPRLLKKEVRAGRLGVSLLSEDVAGAYEKALAEQDLYKVIITTAPMIEGKPVVEVLDVITSECVFGLNIFKDIFASVRDVVGGRNATFQKALRDARIECLAELRREAANLGADAVIGMDLDYSEVSGGGKSMLFLVASGTAVKLSK